MLSLRRIAPVAGALTLLCVAAPVQAQRFGIIAGGTFSNLRSSDDLDFGNRTGTIFGGSLQLPVGSAITIQPEFLFLNKGAKVKQPVPGTTSVQSIRLDYLELPLLLRYDISREIIGPHIYAGPSVGFNVGCQVTFGGNNNEAGARTNCDEDNLKPKRLDYGLTVGAGVDFNLGAIALTGGARYGIGLADIRDDDSEAFKSRVNNGTLSLYVGVVFGSLKKK